MTHVRSLIASDPNWISTLVDTYKVNVNRDGDLVTLKYNQIESPMHEPIVQECRGMVVCAATNRVLAHPYNKFWNHGDALAAQIDWATARVLEKLDGSLMILYWNPRRNRWQVASSGSPTAGGPFSDAMLFERQLTFHDVFWENFFETLDMRLPTDKGVCFMFEMCSAGNRVVVKHDSPRIVLHGARDLSTGAELSMPRLATYAHDHNWELVKSFPLASIDDCIAACAALDPIQCEGFIVVDAQFNRIKIKSPRYVTLHHMKGEGVTVRRAIDLWQAGEAEELLGYFPELAPQVLPVHERIEMLARVASRAVQTLGYLPRKDFAGQVKDKPYAPIAFKLYGLQPTTDAARKILRAQPVAAIERMLATRT
jgi:hypothetical protein